MYSQPVFSMPGIYKAFQQRNSASYCPHFAEKLVKLTFGFFCCIFQLKLMWGNLTLASSEKKDVLVPSLPSGQVGTVSVEFVAPNIEGTYTSHWRLSHRGEQFGPRIWCSIVVDPSPAADYVESDWKDSDSCQKSGASRTKQASHSPGIWGSSELPRRRSIVYYLAQYS